MSDMQLAGTRSKAQLDLHAAHDLEACADDHRCWRATGIDPQFTLKRADGRPIEGGWYRLGMRLGTLDQPLSRPLLYSDFGRGLAEGSELRVSFDMSGNARREALVRFEHRLESLRFDPTDRPGRFVLEDLTLEPLSKWQALRALWSALSTTNADDRQGNGLAWTAASKLLTGGPRAMGDFLYREYSRNPDESVPPDSYTQWLRRFDVAVPADIEERVASLVRKPRISIVMPTFNSPERWLRRCIDSVRDQQYPYWELCVADDASTDSRVRRVLVEYARKDPRIKIRFRDRNGHISASSNDALTLATGEFVALLDHDDELHPMALYEIAKGISENSSWRVIYTDEDKMDVSGRRFDPYFKPDFDPELLLGQNYFCHLTVYSTEIIRAVGGFRVGFEGSQDHDLALRAVESLGRGEIGHIPRVLYHWRAIENSTAMGADQKPYAVSAGVRAVQEHLQRTGVDGEVVANAIGHYRVRRQLPGIAPKVSILIPTRDKSELVRMSVGSILDVTDYPDYEIIIIDNQSVELETRRCFEELTRDPRVKVMPYDKPFNYSALNNAAAAIATGEVIALVNNDVEAIHAGWLAEMVSHAIRPEVGVVGAMLYYPDDTIQHGGVVLGIGGIAGHIYHRRPRGDGGYMGRALLSQELSAVTAACVVVRKSVFDEVGGLDEKMKVAFNDIDFCMRVMAAGYVNLWTPHAELYHHESLSRGYEDTPEKIQRFQQEVAYMQQRWGHALLRDRAYNPNLALDAEPFTLAWPPRTG
jgi:glycosyltransferase involved in cell wall biosynthesis